MAALFTPPRFTPVDGNGLSMPGAKLEFFASGTTTPLDTYTTSDLTTANTNPVVADANGLFPPIYLTSATLYKVVLKTSADVTVWTTDPVEGAPLDTTPSVGLLRGFLSGLTMSNNATTPDSEIDVSEGACTDDTNALGMIYAGGTLDCATTGVDGLDTGTLANSTWYHVFVIDQGNGTNGLLASTSVSTPTMPTGYTFKRRIGSFKTDGSADILLFVQDGDLFQWVTSVKLDFNQVNPGTSAVTRTLAGVPTGVNVIAIIQAILLTASATGSAAYFSDLATTDETVNGSSFTDTAVVSSGGLTSAGSRLSIRTNTSAQIRTRLAFSDANITFRANTLGWIDSRGKNE